MQHNVAFSPRLDIGFNQTRHTKNEYVSTDIYGNRKQVTMTVCCSFIKKKKNDLMNDIPI
jgi:hypothetical protein